MFVAVIGALTGGLLLRRADVAAPLWTAAGLLVGCCLAAERTSRMDTIGGWG